MIPLPSKVAPGDPFTAKLWNQLRECVAALRPQSGANTRILQTPNGFSVSFLPDGMNLKHPFRVLRTGKEFTVELGLVNQVEPTMNNVPISGIDAKTGKPVAGGAPKYSIGTDYDAEGRIWVVLKVVIKPSGIISSATISTTNVWPQPLDPLTAWHPIALFKKQSGDPVLYQQTFHNLGHQWLKPSSGLGRHFFWAV
jgi:hypothetical protein